MTCIGSRISGGILGCIPTACGWILRERGEGGEEGVGEGRGGEKEGIRRQVSAHWMVIV